MGRKKTKFFWHVPPDTWFGTGPVALGPDLNTGPDIVVTLIDTETVQSARPDIDNFIVERIVGQYVVSKNEMTPTNHYAHSRVYVGPTNATSIALRDLASADEAESSFLWHQVDPLPAALDGEVYGTWTDSSSTVTLQPGATPFMGRFGHVDIRVGRRLEGGEALIWHTQIANPPAADDTIALKLWLRLLVREG